MNKVLYSALFGSIYDDFKDPVIITPGWDYVMFTDQPITSSVWDIRQVPIIDTPQRTARYYKIMGWFEWQYSMWIDGSFTINKDLNEWWTERFISPFSCAKHPLRTDIYREAEYCVMVGRGDNGKVAEQLARYKELKVPEYKGIITSGILMRENTVPCIELCKAWWDELSSQSVRDQLAFAFVSRDIDWIHRYVWDYTQSREFIYKKHKHLR